MLLLRRSHIERPPLVTPEFDRSLEQTEKSRNRALEVMERFQKTWLEDALSPPPHHFQDQYWENRQG